VTAEDDRAAKVGAERVVIVDRLEEAARMSRRRGAGLSLVACDPRLEQRLRASGVSDLVHFEQSVAGWLGR
jgi:hypothetical protein